MLTTITGLKGSLLLLLISCLASSFPWLLRQVFVGVRGIQVAPGGEIKGEGDISNPACVIMTSSARAHPMGTILWSVDRGQNLWDFEH